MDRLNPIFVKEMVESIRNESELGRTLRNTTAGASEKSGLVTRSRRVIGALVIDTGRFIQGRDLVNEWK
jgi:hypothetical protein